CPLNPPAVASRTPVSTPEAECVLTCGGLSRSAAGKTAISAASGWPRPHAPLARTSLVACTAPPRRAILRPGDVGDGLGPCFHLGVAGQPSQSAPLAHLLKLHLKAKAVPVAASSSAVASARPTGPEWRPRSLSALRIQRSANHPLRTRLPGPEMTL